MRVLHVVYQVELSREERLGPGGLDPVEVFAELPKPMQKAFEAKDMQMLHQALAAMTPEQARDVMDKCAKSGLWVPEGGEGAVDAGGMD